MISEIEEFTTDAAKLMRKIGLSFDGHVAVHVFIKWVSIICGLIRYIISSIVYYTQQLVFNIVQLFYENMKLIEIHMTGTMTNPMKGIFRL